MGRQVPGAFTPGGASGPYVPNRRYTLPGVVGTFRRDVPDALTVAPFLLRQGRWSLKGLWAAVEVSAGETIAGEARIGLWADNGAGSPGTLIKDSGPLAYPAGFSGQVAAAFTPITLEAVAPRLLHVGVISSRGGVHHAYVTLNDAAGGESSPSELGLPPGTTLFSAAGGNGIVTVALEATIGFTAATPFASSPNLTAARPISPPLGGLIFG